MTQCKIKNWEDFPLLIRTPTRWAARVLTEPLSLLNDHAHLEKKAATNALELLGVWPTREPPLLWTKTLCGIAKDEAHHLHTVMRHLERRGGAFTKNHKSHYASALRALVRKGEGPREIIDRLMVSALIEARSAERFQLLAEEASDPGLSRFYHGLWRSEQGHYRVFFALAALLDKESIIESRWQQLLKSEKSIISSMSQDGSLHSWG